MKELPETLPIKSPQQDEDVTSFNFRFEPTLNLEYISYLEKEELELDEIISLVFLLYEEPFYALQKLQRKLQNGSTTVLRNWASREEKAGNSWQKKVIEALCVIHNYKILKNLGYGKTQMMSQYLPRQPNVAFHINKMKKALYITCEELTKTKTQELLHNVNVFFQENNKVFIDYDSEYLELYLLSWETDGFISKTDVNKFRQVLKAMNEDNIYNMLNIEIFDNQQITRLTNLKFPRYELDPNNPGVLLIVNQEDFHTDVNPDRKHLLPCETSIKLQNRDGSQKDVDSLLNVFTKFGFKVIIEKNLFHNSTLNKIKDVLNDIKQESSVFICILSHGNEGIVYGANSCRIKISKIQSLMCKRNQIHLTGKPKVLILQACQGVKCQKISSTGHYESSTDSEDDGKCEPKNERECQHRPATMDMLTFSSTVPGYASLRDSETGSWFIQAFCKKLEQFGDKEHLVDICTSVIDDVTKRTWKSDENINVMVPVMFTTLRYQLFLPPLKVS